MSECASVSAGSAKSGQSENSTKATPVSAGLTAQVVDRNAMVRIATLTSIDERTECTPCVNVTISNWLIFLRGGHCFALFLLPVRTQLKASKKKMHCEAGLLKKWINNEDANVWKTPSAENQGAADQDDSFKHWSGPTTSRHTNLGRSMARMDFLHSNAKPNQNN